MDYLEEIIRIIKARPLISSTEILISLENRISVSTLKRLLQELSKEGIICSSGEKKARRYSLSELYQINQPINVDEYFELEIDERKINEQYNFSFFAEILQKVSIFNEKELSVLNDLQTQFLLNISNLSEQEYKKEWERLAIDLSWKSSQIEGNTYSLLETELLIKEKTTASGKTRDEASMLLNHKDALDFIIEHPDYILPLSTARIEDIHSILVKDLNVDKNIRKRRVGISGTNYRPLENEFQIKEALNEMCLLINNKENIFEKALLALLLISYIQPFADGNKRTARIISNGILINYKYCPISFRTVDPIAYKKALLIFYEQQNLYPFKQIFIEQFMFAVKTYF